MTNNDDNGTTEEQRTTEEQKKKAGCNCDAEPYEADHHCASCGAAPCPVHGIDVESITRNGPMLCNYCREERMEDEG